MQQRPGGRKKSTAVQREPLLAKDVAAMATAMRIPGRSKMTTEQKRAAIGRPAASASGATTTTRGGVDWRAFFKPKAKTKETSPEITPPDRPDRPSEETQGDEGDEPSKALNDAISLYTLALAFVTKQRFVTYQTSGVLHNINNVRGDESGYVYYCNKICAVSNDIYAQLEKVASEARPKADFHAAWFPVWARLHTIIFGRIMVDFGGKHKAYVDEADPKLKRCSELYGRLESMLNRSKDCRESCAKYKRLHRALYLFDPKAIVELADERLLPFVVPYFMKRFVFGRLEKLYREITDSNNDGAKQEMAGLLNKILLYVSWEPRIDTPRFGDVVGGSDKKPASRPNRRRSAKPPKKAGG